MVFHTEQIYEMCYWKQTEWNELYIYMYITQKLVQILNSAQYMFFLRPQNLQNLHHSKEISTTRGQLDNFPSLLDGEMSIFSQV